MVLTYKMFSADSDRLHPLARQGLFDRQCAAARLGLAGPDRSRRCTPSRRLAGNVAGVRHTVAIAGQSLLWAPMPPNFGSMYVMLDEFHDRAAEHRPGDAIADAAEG